MRPDWISAPQTFIAQHTHRSLTWTWMQMMHMLTPTTVMYMHGLSCWSFESQGSKVSSVEAEQACGRRSKARESPPPRPSTVDGAAACASLANGRRGKAGYCCWHLHCKQGECKDWTATDSKGWICFCSLWDKENMWLLNKESWPEWRKTNIFLVFSLFGGSPFLPGEEWWKITGGSLSQHDKVWNWKFVTSQNFS